jgi:hypothetical protein
MGEILIDKTFRLLNIQVEIVDTIEESSFIIIVFEVYIIKYNNNKKNIYRFDMNDWSIDIFKIEISNL